MVAHGCAALCVFKFSQVVQILEFPDRVFFPVFTGAQSVEIHQEMLDE